MSLPQFETNESPLINQGKRTILFDFQRGDLLTKNMTVQTAEGKEAIKNKIEKLVYTEKKLSPIYKNSEYGINKRLVIGKEYYTNIKLVEELSLDIKSAIMKISGVKSIDKFSTNIENDILVIRFEVDTIYGTVGGEI